MLKAKMTIGQATGFKVERGEGSYLFLRTYDPFLKQWSGDGYDKTPVFGVIRDSELEELGIMICPSDEELKMIESLRATNRVARAAIDLSAAIDEWLKHPERR